MDIFAAAKLGDEGQVAALLDMDPALLETVSPAGCTPLQWAAKHGRLGVVTLLVQQRGATVNSVPGGATSALAYAFNGRHGEVVSFLLAHGAAATTVNTYDETLLITACRRGQLDLVTVLLPHMTTELVNHQDQYGKTALHYAVGGSHGDVGTFMLDHGVSADTVDSNGRTPLMTACIYGLLGVVQRAVQQLPVERVNLSDQYGKTALHYAVGEGHGDVGPGAFLLDHGASVDTVDTYGVTPLMRACSKGLLGVVQRIVQQLPAERVDHQDQYGRTALHCAASQPNGQVAALLLAHGASVDAVDRSATTPLMTACHYGQLDAVRPLLPHMTTERVDRQDQDGKTALHHAVGQRHGDLGAFLLDHGASVDTVDMDGTTLLMMACSNGLLGVVHRAVQQLPVERVNHPDQYGRTALHHAVSGKHTDVGAFLLDHGASVDTVDANGTTPLMRACTYGLLGVVQRAVQQLPVERVNHPDQYGRTAFYYAVFEGYEDMGTFMLDHGASASTVDTYGKTPFMRACSKGLLRVVQRAIQQLPAELMNHKDQFGETALHYAVNSDQGEVVKVLLYAGADPTIMRHDGRTPCIVAEEDGRSTCIAVLRQWMRGEGQRNMLQRAVWVHDTVVEYDRNPTAARSAVLSARVASERALPQVEIVTGQEQEEGGGLPALVGWLIKAAPSEVFKEVMDTLTGPRQTQ